MAIIITDECINCGACEPECPNNAIYEGGVEWTFTDGTNLSGEVKTDDGSIHDRDNEYFWYDSNPETNGGDAGTSGDETDTEDFIEVHHQRVRVIMHLLLTWLKLSMKMVAG